MNLPTTLATDTEFKIIGQKSWGDLDWGIFLQETGYRVPCSKGR